jgi:DNA-directed RNA polymerase specialized sigma24 family protein
MAVPSRAPEVNLDLVQANREEAYDFVLAYARGRFGRYEDLIILEDVVDDVFEDLKNGVRHLTASKTPLQSLYGMIDSKRSHWMEKQRRHDSLDVAPEVAVSRDPVEEIDFHLLCDALCELCQGELLLLEMLSLWEDDPSLKPGDLAELMGVDVTNVYKAKERLKSLTAEIREEWLFRC